MLSTLILVAPTCRRRSSTTAVRLVALTAVEGFSWSGRRSPRTHSQRLRFRNDWMFLSGGRLVVEVSDAPVNDVIGAVAAAAGAEMSTVGPIARRPVSG